MFGGKIYDVTIMVYVCWSHSGVDLEPLSQERQASLKGLRVDHDLQ